MPEFGKKILEVLEKEDDLHCLQILDSKVCYEDSRKKFQEKTSNLQESFDTITAELKRKNTPAKMKMEGYFKLYNLSKILGESSKESENYIQKILDLASTKSR